MNDTTRQAIETAAVTRATELCDASLATIAKGRTEWVKGKKTTVPFGAEKRASLKRLQLSAFESDDYGTQSRVADLLSNRVDGEPATDALFQDAMAVYCEAGRAEVERLFAA